MVSTIRHGTYAVWMLGKYYICVKGKGNTRKEWKAGLGHLPPSKAEPQKPEDGAQADLLSTIILLAYLPLSHKKQHLNLSETCSLLFFVRRMKMWDWDRGQGSSKS